MFEAMGSASDGAIRAVYGAGKVARDATFAASRAAERAFDGYVDWRNATPMRRKVMTGVEITVVVVATAAVIALASRGSSATGGGGDSSSSDSDDSPPTPWPAYRPQPAHQASEPPPAAAGHPARKNLGDMNFASQRRWGYADENGYWTDKGYDRATQGDLDGLEQARGYMINDDE